MELIFGNSNSYNHIEIVHHAYILSIVDKIIGKSIYKALNLKNI